MGIIQEWKQIKQLNDELGRLLKVNRVQVTYIKSEQAITVRKVTK